MGDGTEFIKEIFKRKLNDINCCMIGRITVIDKQKSKVEVKPLHKTYIGNDLIELPVLVDVPLLQFMSSEFIIKLPINIGDLVLLVFADYDIQNLSLDGELHEPNTRAVHSLNDAIAVPLGLNPFNNNLAVNNTNDLYIGTKNNNAKIKMDTAGNVTIDTMANIYLGDGATEGIPKGATLKTWLDGHRHTDPQGGNTGTPTTLSPNPSTMVKVK